MHAAKGSSAPIGLLRPGRADATLGASLAAEEGRVAVRASMLAMQTAERPNEEVTVADAPVEQLPLVAAPS